MKGGLLGAVVGGLGGAAAGVAIARKKLLKKNDEIQRLTEEIQRLQGPGSFNEAERTHRAEIEALVVDKRVLEAQVDAAEKLAEAANVSSTDEDDTDPQTYAWDNLGLEGDYDDTDELHDTPIDTLHAEHTTQLQALREQHSGEMKKQKENHDLTRDRIAAQHSGALLDQKIHINDIARKEKSEMEGKHRVEMAEAARLKEVEHAAEMAEAARLKEEEHAAEMAEAALVTAEQTKTSIEKELRQREREILEKDASILAQKLEVTRHSETMDRLREEHGRALSDKDLQHVDKMQVLTNRCVEKNQLLLDKIEALQQVKRVVGRARPKVPSSKPPTKTPVVASGGVAPKSSPQVPSSRPPTKTPSGRSTEDVAAEAKEKAKRAYRAEVKAKREADVLRQLGQTDKDDPN